MLLAFLGEPFRLCGKRKNYAWGSSIRRHSYLSRGFYSRQAGYFLAHFPRRQLLIVPSTSLRWKQEETLRCIYRFLGIRDTRFIPEQQSVCVGNYDRKRVYPASGLLRLLYARETRRLRHLGLMRCP
jgi:hypothetical protein